MSPPLLPEHLADLQMSGLSDATIIRCGLHSVRPADLKACPIHGILHALAFPYLRIDGSPLDFQRWKLFYTDEAGERPKYWQPKGSDPLPYFPPVCNWQSLAGDPTQTLLITEGEKKSIAGCQAGLPCIGIAGVWNWRAKLDTGARFTLPGLDRIAWKGRVVELVPDSDVWRPEKEQALSGFYALGRELRARGATVVLVKLPETA
jgi:hypothetical protein